MLRRGRGGNPHRSTVRRDAAASAKTRSRVAHGARPIEGHASCEDRPGRAETRFRPLAQACAAQLCIHAIELADVLTLHAN